MRENLLAEMSSHWESNLGLTNTQPLAQGWEQFLVATEQVRHSNIPWQVLQLPTGAGKTEALKVYCASQCRTNCPGTLIVTRFTNEADRIADDINQYCGSAIALAVHAKQQYELTAIQQCPVLVITHSAYRNALKEIASNADHKPQWQRVWQYHHSERSLLIIDESFDWIEGYEVRLRELASLCADLSNMPAFETHGILGELSDFCDSLSQWVANDASDKALTGAQIKMLCGLNLTHLRSLVSSQPHRELDLWTSIEKSEKAMRKAYLDVLGQLQLIQSTGQGWLSKRGNRVCINGSRLLMDYAPSKGIILDATASTDPIYKLLSGRVELIPRPSGIRNYVNVTLNISPGHRVGKEYLSKHGKGLWPSLCSAVNENLEDSQKALVICHKDVEQELSLSKLNVNIWSSAHWGDLDGKNEWNDFDTSLIFGLPYLDDIVPTNMFLACHPNRSDAWFSGNRDHGSHSDMGRVIKDGFIAKSLIQAINRTRCRKPLDEAGNCQPTRVFLLTGNQQTTLAILKAVQSQMPGIIMRQWDAGISKRKLKLTPVEEKLVSFLASSGAGTFTKSSIIDRLNISDRTFERVSAKIQNSSTYLAAKLTSIGVEYHCVIGRGREAYFMKT